MGVRFYSNDIFDHHQFWYYNTGPQEQMGQREIGGPLCNFQSHKVEPVLASLQYLSNCNMFLNMKCVLEEFLDKTEITICPHIVSALE